MTAYGIDVSSIQSATVDRSGIAFTVVKATEGQSYTNPDHGSQVATARAAGHLVGHYHYLWPGNIDSQARHFVQQANPQPGDFLACDWEATNGGSATTAEKDHFLALVQQLAPGHRVVLYCNRDFWNNHDTSGNAGDGLWIADPDHPAGSPRISAPWIIHQYGEDGGVDLDVYNGTTDELRAWAGAPDAAPSEPAPGGDAYTVVSGDTLSGIAAAHGVSLSALEQANPQIANPDLIYPGQRIAIPGGSAPAPSGGGTYTVVSGDNLSAIAAAHGVSLSALENANPQIRDFDLIYPGQEINLP